MITCRLYRSGTLAEEGFDPALVSEHLEVSDSLVWLDLEEPNEQELAMIQEEFSLHPLAVEDAQHRGQRSKVEIYEQYFFLVMHAVRLGDGELIDQEVHAFVGPSYLVTLRYPPAFDLKPVLQRWERQQELTKEGGDSSCTRSSTRWWTGISTWWSASRMSRRRSRSTSSTTNHRATHRSGSSFSRNR